MGQPLAVGVAHAGCAIEATRCPLVSHMMNNSHHTFVHTFYYVLLSVLVCINSVSVYTRSMFTYNRNTTIAIMQYQRDYQFMFSICVVTMAML